MFYNTDNGGVEYFDASRDTDGVNTPPQHKSNYCHYLSFAI